LAAQRTRKWEGATFKAGTKFVMRMKHLRSMTRKDSFGKDEPTQVFNVTITPAGSSFAVPFWNGVKA